MQRQQTIGVLTPFLGGNYYAEIIQNIHKIANQLNVNLIIIRTSGKYYNVPVAMNRVDGWLVVNVAVEDHFLKQLEERYQKPVVVVAKDIRKLKMKAGMVVVDNKRAAYEAVMHLYQHGHRNIGFIGSPNMDDVHYRYLGYIEAMKDLGIEVKSSYLYDVGDMTVFGGKKAAEQLIADRFPITAAVACTDMCGFGIVEKLLEKGYRVPEDFALIGFDNSSTARHSAISISSIEQNLKALIQHAMEKLLLRIEDEKQSFAMDVLPCRMITRRSCGCCNNEQELLQEKTDVGEYANHINALRTENNVNYEFNRYILSYQFKKIQDLATLLEHYFNWGAIMRQNGYTMSKEPKLSIHDYYHFTDGVSEFHDMHDLRYEALQNNPPNFTMKEPSDDNEVVYVIPYRLTQNNWSLLSFGTSYEKTLARSTDYMRMVHLFDIISNTFDRIALLDESANLNQQHQSLKERHEVFNRLTDDILFEIDFSQKKVWLNRKMKFKITDTPLLGLEIFVHQDDIPLLRKHFYDHFRENKPFYTELRIKDAKGHFYLANVSAESTRDRMGNIQKLLGSIRDISKLRMKEESSTLHGVFNRRRFYEAIKGAINEGTKKFALCVLDIDNFKLINDLYGHHIGDDVIEQISEVLIRSLKEGDHVSRFGGDEFVILFQYDRVDEVDQFALELSELITRRMNHINRDINLSMSIGASLYPDDGQDYEELLRKADIALFQVKHNGKNNYLKFDPYMVDYQQEKRKMEKVLREALANNRFILVFQPQVYARTKRFYGVEVLLRLRTESGDIVTPDQFIPVAESVGLIVPIGAWVIRAACEQGMEWIKQGYDPIKISINISGLQLKSIQFLSTIKEIIEDTGMNPANLTFEITESTIIDQSFAALQVIEEIRKLGISVAIDDFGISYSSLSVLKNFPIEILKIDKSFIREMVTDEKGYKIVNAIINIAKSLDLKIVAEGVEDSTQLELLDELGCQFIQGYYISKPVAEFEIEKFLVQRIDGRHRQLIEDNKYKDGNC